MILITARWKKVNCEGREKYSCRIKKRSALFEFVLIKKRLFHKCLPSQLIKIYPKPLGAERSFFTAKFLCLLRGVASGKLFQKLTRNFVFHRFATFLKLLSTSSLTGVSNFGSFTKQCPPSMILARSSFSSPSLIKLKGVGWHWRHAVARHPSFCVILNTSSGIDGYEFN